MAGWAREPLNYYEQASLNLTKDLIRVTKTLMKDGHPKLAKITMDLAETAFYSEFPKN